MSSRPQTPSHHEAYASVPAPSDPSHLSRGYGSRRSSSHYGPGTSLPGTSLPGTTGADDVMSAPAAGAPADTSLLGQSAPLDDELLSSHRGSALIDGQPTHDTTHDATLDTTHDTTHNIGEPHSELHRSDSQLSQGLAVTPGRSGTLKKKASLKRGGSLKRSNSKRSSYAGSVRSLNLGEKEKYSSAFATDEQMSSAFFTPVPTSGNPTEILANRFQAWRKVLKDLVAFFRDVQKTYEGKSKALLASQNVLSNTQTPPVFLLSGGIADANGILRDFHKQAVAEANKAKEIENDVVMQLTGLRSDLQQKIKEIKSLSGDFKNSVDKELEGTKRAVNQLTESLGFVDSDASTSSGKGDPFIVKLGVDKQVEKQIEEENYLHRAFLNLESSGRELESIVVGEIQKAHNAYAGILKREADASYEAVERLRSGPIALPKDHEWDAFVEHNDNMVDPRIPVRHVENIQYPGKDHPAAAEVRAGMLERKSKYLKSYTPGWYVLSPTHLHEFKSADRISSQPPVMSLYLPEQKLGSHSQTDSSSHKFMLKGRQTGSMHRGHAWVFRAESHDTMLAWFEDIKNLTEKRGEDRNAFVRKHARSMSGGSQKPGSINSGGDSAMEEDEADVAPFSASASVMNNDPAQDVETRPQPGGRFPSDLHVNRESAIPLSPSSGESSGDRDVIAAASGLPGSGVHHFDESAHPVTDRDPMNTQTGGTLDTPTATQRPASYVEDRGHIHQPHAPVRQSSNYGSWMAPATAGAGGAVVGAVGLNEFHHDKQEKDEEQHKQEIEEHRAIMMGNSPTSNGAVVAGAAFTQVPAAGTHAPIVVDHDGPRGISASEPSQADSLSTVPTSVGPSTTNSEDMAALAARAATNKKLAEQSAASYGPDRPTSSRHQSTTTISDLYIPGQYPGTPTFGAT